MKTNSFFQKNRTLQSGNVLIIVMVLFVVLSVSIAIGLVVPVIRANRTAENNLQSKRSYAFAESGIEDVVYRLKSSMDVSTSETLVLGSQEVTTSVSDVSGGNKQVVAIGNVNERNRTIAVTVSQGVGVSFNYGVQTGRGGVSMSNNSQIVGNVYSHGNVTGSGFITGAAIAANSDALFADQINDTPITPPSSINVRRTSATVDFAQGFQLTEEGPINKIQLYIKKVGTPTNATVRIVSDVNGVPSTTNILNTQGTLSAAAITTSYGWLEVVFPSNPTLYAGTPYWVVIDNSSTSSSNYYVLGANDAVYTARSAKIGTYASTWNALSPATLDSYFKIFLGGLTSQITGVTVGSAGVGDAWAHTISGATVAGTKYCQVGTGCNTGRSDPTPIGFPISDANIETWKDDAVAGGTIVGNYTAVNGATLGPKKITGNLIVNNGVTLTLTGTVWVQGTITLSNNVIVRLSSAYGTSDGVILSDGKIAISNNATFQGSGTSGSYILVLTTSKCPVDASCGGGNAISLGNNGGAAVFNAQKGTISLSNNTGLKEATAEKLLLENNAVVTYESGLANMNFSSGPSGSWSIESWKETQ